MGANHSEEDLKEIVIDGPNKLDRLLPSGETLLTACIETGNIVHFKELLQVGVSRNVTNRNGDTPLIKALRTCNSDIIKILAGDHRTNVNKSGRFGTSPLQLAVMSGNVECVKLLLGNGAYPNGIPRQKLDQPSNSSTPLDCGIDNEVMVKLLLDHGASVNIGCPLLAAITKHCTKSAIEIVRTSTLDIKQLLNCEHDVVASVARLHNCELLKSLITKGLTIRADKPHQQYPSKIRPNFKSEVGALAYIIHYGCWECFRFMLSHIKDIDQEDLIKMTMLEYALYSTGWQCYRFSSEKFPTCECAKHPYQIPLRGISYKLTSARLDFAKELLLKGADLSKVWDNAICCNQQGIKYEWEREAVCFCIKAYHCQDLKHIKRTFLFRNMITKDTLALALVYLDGYKLSEDDITIAENKLKALAERSMCPKLNISYMWTMPRTLKNCAVISIRQVIGPNVFKAVTKLPIPQLLKDRVLLEDIRGMLPINH